jgi:hypothetical protein
MRIEGEDGHDWLSGGPNADTVIGGPGDDMLRGLGGRGNRLFGQDGRDIMHDADDGRCDGGLPADDLSCATTEWIPNQPYAAGDCCCHSCGSPRGCVYSDLTPGVSVTPPAPW